ncbi:unnamed protein product [Brassicogethes aeneus]|uniref:WD repeat-containing protein 55 homolog n=1 Tax=Brassicogethes aeneus TaxID=1431903 RepID=A0A9P0B2V3_BRAAE|nr:unnamed protein product [Brassicogethes aeneus]
MEETKSPSRILCAKNKNNVFIRDYLVQRSLGNKCRIGFNDDLSFKLYSKFNNYVVKSERNKSSNCLGGIFNLEFSLDGRILVAACEGKQVLLYDAANQRMMHTIENAHKNCVNCIRFLDDKTFATCSDDTSIKLWDTRYLKSAKKTLHGHSNWVKNIEYSEKENVMVTSAFDGSIYAWNLKSPTENSMLYEKVFLMNGLMRTKLSPDGTKMVISTTNGYMIIVHDLNLENLALDLRSFRPNLYRLMQTSDQNFPVGTIFNYLFNPNRKRNRIEFIEDFQNDAEVISSLQIHPHGWCAVSRNLDCTETEEWTSVHDIQKRNPSDYENAFKYIEEEEDVEEETNQRPTDLWMGYRENRDRMVLQNLYENYQLAMGIINSGLIGRNSYQAYFQHHPEQRNKIIKNLKRMTHYVKEKNVGKGYIKELCFSSDGRIICSPYGKGVRLLGFNESMQELSYCVPEEPKELQTLLELNDYHKDVVVSCKFSPNHLQFVSGCLGSEIKWYQPVF